MIKGHLICQYTWYEDNIKMDLWETNCKDEKWIGHNNAAHSGFSYAAV
jgi:hypothetical protein